MRSDRLAEVAPELERILTRGAELPERFGDSEIHRETVWVTMRDGMRLATDVHLPPNLPAPAIAVRTPYGRADAELSEALRAFGRAGYVVVSQDCRGTGDSEPDTWDCYVYESEDSVDFVSTSACSVRTCRSRPRTWRSLPEGDGGRQMAQNVYDDPAFFAGYSDFPRSRLGLAGTAEWPSFRALLPAIAGKRVIELGCGFGHLSRWLAGEGAHSVLGLDLSEKMLDGARAATHDPAVDYRRADLDTLVLEAETADLVVSSMTLHYVADFDRIASAIHAALVPGGDLVFSVEHPLYSARAVPEWVRADDGRQAFAITDYSVEGPRQSNWIIDGVVKYHRTIATMLNSLAASGFTYRGMDEWRPSEAQLDAHKDWRQTELTRPMFLIVAVHKPERVH